MTSSVQLRSHSGKLAALIAVIALIGLAGACRSEAPQSSGETGTDLERGAVVYASSCASCHGADMRGTDDGPSHLSIVYEPNHHSDDSFRSAIAKGAPQHHWTFGDMEPVEGLSDADVAAVIDYVRAEQERQGFEG
jgi:mono/diheme cytochrome c family protein